MLGLALQHLLQQVVGDLGLTPDRAAALAPASSRPRSESVANTTAAAYPSVRSRSASAASSDNSSPPLAATSRASFASKARTVVPISTRSPPARRQPSGTRGSPRVTNTN